MSALANGAISVPIIDRDAIRSAIFVRPATTGPAHRVWTLDSYSLPVPGCVSHLVRSGRQWSDIVGAAIREFAGRDSGYALGDLINEQGPYLTFIRTLMYLGPDSETFGRLVLMVFPPKDCRNPMCHRLFVHPSAQVKECSDECRRVVAYARVAADKRRRRAARRARNGR